jgi:hypothetical protein
MDCGLTCLRMVVKQKVIEGIGNKVLCTKPFRSRGCTTLADGWNRLLLLCLHTSGQGSRKWR